MVIESVSSSTSLCSPEHLYEESERGRDFKQRPRSIGREKKGQEYEAETQEVKSTYRKEEKEAGI